MKLTRRAPGWDGNVVAGNILTLRLPIGLTFHQAYIEYAFLATATPVAWADAIGEVRVMANGRPIWSIQGSELDVKTQFESRSAFQGIATFDFDRYNLRTRGAEEFTSLGTGMVGDPTPLVTLTLELDVKSGSAITSGTLSSRIRQSESRILAMFKKIRRFTNQFTGASTYEIDDYPKGDLINQILLFQSAGEIDSLRLERDRFVMFDRTKELNARIQTDGVRTPMAGLYVLDTSEDGNGVDQIVTDGISDLRLFVELDATMTITSIVEYIGSLER